MDPDQNVSDNPTVKQGLDVDRYRQFVEFARENPDAVKGELRAVGEYEGTAYHTATHIGSYTMGGEEAGLDRDYTLHIGVPQEFEERTGFERPVDRMESVEVVLGALTTCVSNTLSQGALMDDIDVDRITTSVSVPIDLGVLLGVRPTEEREHLVGEPSVEVVVHGEDLTDADEERLAAMIDRSPVYALVTLPHPTTPTVTVARDD